MISLTKNEEKIINFLADSPQESFFTSEIAKKTVISLGGCHNALNSLKDKKMIKFEAKGNMKFWQINFDNVLVRQCRITCLINKLDNLIKELKPLVLKIILFGSGARGEYDKNSDIDLLILTNNQEDAIKIINKYAKKYFIKPIIKTPNQWHELEVNDKEFYHEVSGGTEL